MKNNNKQLLDGFVSRRNESLNTEINHSNLGAAGIRNLQDQTVKPRKSRRRLLNGKKEPAWQDKALLSEVLSGAAPSEPLNSESKPKKIKSKNWKKRAKLLLIPFLLLAGFYGWKAFSLSGVLGGGNPLDFFKSTKLRGEDKGKVNIMLIGTSEDDPNHPGEDLTDSIMVISYDVNLKKAVIISIPRDLWVKTSYASTKINALYHYGKEANFNESGYYSGGIGLLQKELEKITGLDIGYYAKVNYGALKDAVDAVGGIEVDIQGTDERGIYDPNFDGEYGKNALKLKNGLQTINGTQALLLSRARNANGGYGLAGSDYDRTANQRKMLIALKDKATKANVFANPIKVSQLSSALENNVKTDLKPEEVRRIYELSKQEGSSVSSVGLTSENVLKNYSSEGTGAALIPTEGIGEYDEIKKFINEQISKTEASDAAEKEEPKVMVLNAGGATGAATRYANELPYYAKKSGAGNTTIQTEGSSLVVINSSKTKSKEALMKDLSIAEYGNQEDTAKLKAKYPEVDFIVLVGK